MAGGDAHDALSCVLLNERTNLMMNGWSSQGNAMNKAKQGAILLPHDSTCIPVQFC